MSIQDQLNGLNEARTSHVVVHHELKKKAKQKFTAVSFDHHAKPDVETSEALQNYLMTALQKQSYKPEKFLCRFFNMECLQRVLDTGTDRTVDYTRWTYGYAWLSELGKGY